MDMLDAKASAKRLIPPIAVDLIGLARKTAEYWQVRSLLQRNRAQRDRYLGQTAYVVGNGPSLRNFNVGSLCDKHILTMNHFELHPLASKLKPVAHCMGDPLFEWQTQDPAPMIFGVDAATYWVNVDAEPLFSAYRGKQFHYYLQAVRPSAEILQGSNLSGLALQYQSTAQMAVMVALYMGFKRILLLGLDHDWLVTRGVSPHFYEEREGVAVADHSGISYTQKIRISLKLFETYEKIQRVAKAKGATILNLSAPSYLDVFPTRGLLAEECPHADSVSVPGTNINDISGHA